MAFSTEAQLTANAPILGKTFSVSTTPTLTAFATDRIALADKMIEVECAGYINFDDFTIDETTPVINLLSQYKAAEMALRRVAGIKRRHNENDDISEWKQMYDDLKKKIKENSIPVELADGTTVKTGKGVFQNTARPNIRPVFGYGPDLGEWINNDDMEEVRGDPDDSLFPRP